MKAKENEQELATKTIRRYGDSVKAMLTQVGDTFYVRTRWELIRRFRNEEKAQAFFQGLEEIH